MKASSKITIKEVAKYCDVSIATVSRVLNGSHYVSNELSNSVNKAIAELGYTPNYVARSLKLKKTGMIGYITSDISNSYHITIAKALEDVISPLNYNLIVCSTSNNQSTEKKYLRLLHDRSVDAIVLNSCGKCDNEILQLNSNTPMVLVNRRIMTPQFIGDYVDCNNQLGMFLLTKDLLKHGHTKILLVMGPNRLSNMFERLSGFQMAMQEANINTKSDYPYYFEGDFDKKTGFEAIKSMQYQPREYWPTAVIGCNNTITLGILNGLIHYGIHVPDEISVAGFNSIEDYELLNLRPTVAAFDPYVIGKSAAVALMQRLTDQQIPNREFIFPPTLLYGNTVCDNK